jgi:hypothetical protein
MTPEAPPIPGSDMHAMTLPGWVDLRQACAYKGVAYNTVANRRELQPPRAKAVYMGKMKWAREVVEEWAQDTRWEPLRRKARTA